LPLLDHGDGDRDDVAAGATDPEGVLPLAQAPLAATPLARREIIQRLGTSPSQLYRLLDQTNYRKSVDQLLRLLKVLDCDVQLVVRAKSA
jgi:hypothetical protein